MIDKKFDPMVYKCIKCETFIFSRFEGQFVSCKCGAISVDETRYYGRMIGEPENFVPVGKLSEEAE